MVVRTSDSLSAAPCESDATERKIEAKIISDFTGSTARIRMIGVKVCSHEYAEITYTHEAFVRCSEGTCRGCGWRGYLSSMSPVLQVRDLTKRYGVMTAVDGVSLAIESGEILGLIGPNGAGKTTTIECILGLRQADSGSIFINEINALRQPALVRQLVGAQLQSTELPEKITPREALRLFGAFYRKRVESDTFLARFGLEEKADAAFETLSGGQRQRLALALAFLHAPRLLILDEPTGGLDPAVRRELLDIVAACRDEGCSVLLCTHQLDEAERLCDRVAIIDRGRLVAMGKPGALIAQASGSARIKVRFAHPVSRATLGGLYGVDEIAAKGEGWSLSAPDVNQTVKALADLAAREGNTLLELEIQRPSLEDAFFALTGRSWPAPAPIS